MVTCAPPGARSEIVRDAWARFLVSAFTGGVIIVFTTEKCGVWDVVKALNGRVEPVGLNRTRRLKHQKYSTIEFGGIEH